MKKIKTLLLLFFIFSSIFISNLFSQSVNESVKKLQENGRLEDADVLLQKYHREHPKDLKSTILFAQVCYELKKYPAFFDLYEEAFVLDPENHFLRFDYAKMLLEINEYEMAQFQFDEYLKYDPANIDALLATSKISIANEDYDPASAALSKILRKDPTNKEARDLYDQVLIAKSKWVKLNAIYTSNSQPVNKISPVLEAGLYTSPYSTLKLTLSPMLYTRNKNSNVNMYWGFIENRSFIREVGIGINYGLGTIMFPENSFGLMGKIHFDKYAERYILLELEGQRKPYLSSLPSLDTAMMILSGSSSLTLITKESWNGKATVEANMFEYMDNPVTSLDAFLYAPRLKANNFSFKLGYKFDFSTSKEDRFYSDKTTAEILNSPAPVYTGDYYPYYTPKNLISHSALLSIGFQPSVETQTGLDISYAFVGSGEKGYYLRSSNPAGDMFVSKAYRTENNIPVDVNFYLQSLLTPKVLLGIDFKYSKNFFYISRYVGMSVRIGFWK